MSEQDFPPVPPTPPSQPAVPPVRPAAPQQQYSAPQQYPHHAQQLPPASAAYAPAPVPASVPAPRRSRAWMWWTIGIVLSLALLIGSCSIPLFLLGSTDGGFEDGAFDDAVAVIRVDGVIAGTGDYYSGYVTPEYFYDQLKQAQDDERVKAIVLRVDSPGGTVAASEELAAYVKQCRKPIFVSVGDVGASGAYMLASQADEIWAMPGSAVGSIGVISEIPNVSTLLDKVGVEFQVIHAGKYKDAGSPYRPLTKEETALIQGEVDEAYGQFIDIVAKGRKMDRSKVESLATGWVWSGEKAKELGLIDEIGTYRQALDAAADAGGIEGDYDVVTYEEDLGGLLSAVLGVTEKLDRISAALEAPGTESSVRRSLPR